QYLNPPFLDIATCKSSLFSDLNSEDVGIRYKFNALADFNISLSIFVSFHFLSITFFFKPVSLNQKSVPPFWYIALDNPESWLFLISVCVGKCFIFNFLVNSKIDFL